MAVATTADTTAPSMYASNSDDAMYAPGSAATAATLEHGQAATPMLTSSVMYSWRMPVQPAPRDHDWYDRQRGYIPGDYSREGFLIEPGNWWIGNQPFLPYFGYNPPTIDGYYPPYAYGVSYPSYGGGYYGYQGGYYPQYYGQIVPAPPLAQPPGYVPAIRIPVAPPPQRISRARGGGFVVERDPNFSIFWTPRPPSYVTSGSAIYQRPSPFFPYPPYPYPY